jgi:hypothetical protein
MPEGIAELCVPYRAAQRVEGLALIADRIEAKKLLAAFTLFPLPAWRRPRTRMPEDGRERWIWLWSGYEGGPMQPRFLDGLASVAGISAEAAYRVWPALMTSRVLYPDGTLSDDAQILLRAHVMRSLPPAPKTPTPPKRGSNG